MCTNLDPARSKSNETLEINVLQKFSPVLFIAFHTCNFSGFLARLTELSTVVSFILKVHVLSCIFLYLWLK